MSQTFKVNFTVKNLDIEDLQSLLDVLVPEHFDVHDDTIHITTEEKK